MRCKKKTESIIPSKLKVLSRGWRELGGGRGRLEKVLGGLGSPAPELSVCRLPRGHLGRQTQTSQPRLGGDRRR